MNEKPGPSSPAAEQGLRRTRPQPLNPEPQAFGQLLPIYSGPGEDKPRFEAEAYLDRKRCRAWMKLEAEIMPTTDPPLSLPDPYRATETQGPGPGLPLNSAQPAQGHTTRLKLT